MSKYNLRGDNPNQYDDTLLLNNQNKSFSCKGCELVFRNEKAYLLHQAGCITVKVDMSKQGSFFNNKARSERFLHKKFMWLRMSLFRFYA